MRDESDFDNDLPNGALDSEQEAELARAIEAGLLAQDALASGTRPMDATDAELRLVAAHGRAAWDRFVQANARLVSFFARAEARRSGLGRDDLAQEGFVALVGALQRFDHTRGRFSTYAVPHIRHQIVKAASARLGELGLPPSVAVLRRRILAITSRLNQQNQRPATAAEVSTEIGRRSDWTQRLITHSVPRALVDKGGEKDIPDANAGVDLADAKAIERTLAELPHLEQSVLRLRFGFTGDHPLSYAATGQRLGLTVTRVRRLEERGLRHFRYKLATPV